MRFQVLLSIFLVAFLVTDTCHGAEKSKKKKSNKKSDSSKKVPDSKMFDSSTLKCLVCRAIVDEFKSEIYKVDPKKMIDTGTFRVNEKGEQARSIVSCC
jgi:hypothetical protein